MTDGQIVALYFLRSEQAIAETSKKYGAYCMTIADNLLGNRQDAEECVNDTYLRLWNVIPPKKPDSLRPFAGRVTHNLAVDRLRRSGAAKRGGNEILTELCDCLPDGETDASCDGLSDSINGYLASVSEEKRRIFVCRYFYGMPLRELSKSAGIGENTLKSTLRRLREGLRGYLTKEGFGI